jgi:dienelactone hydrolase
MRVALGSQLMVGVAAALCLIACSASVADSVATSSAAASDPDVSGGDGPPAPATPDPSRFAPAEPPPSAVRSSETDHGVTVVDLSFGVEGDETDAYLVRPASGKPGPGIVFFHWVEYGAPTSNRTEFLDEAQDLARQGAVSLLVDGRFPWRATPTSIAHDVPAVEADARMLRHAVDLLAAQPEVDAERMALVGHDFGAMYSAIVFGADPTVDGMVMMAPTARWSDWFLRYWQIADPAEAYEAAMAPLDPVTWLPEAAGRPMRLQFASDDQYVPQAVAAEIAAAAGSSAEVTTYETGHPMSDEARADRAAWLTDLLGLAPAP